MTLKEWQALARQLHARAEGVSQSILDRARREARLAGLDPRIAFLHAHNACVSRKYGKPWPEVDYSRARRVLWLERKSREPGRLVNRILDRVWETVQWPG